MRCYARRVHRLSVGALGADRRAGRLAAGSGVSRHVAPAVAAREQPHQLELAERQEHLAGVASRAARACRACRCRAPTRSSVASASARAPAEPAWLAAGALAAAASGRVAAARARPAALAPGWRRPISSACGPRERRGHAARDRRHVAPERPRDPRAGELARRLARLHDAPSSRAESRDDPLARQLPPAPSARTRTAAPRPRSRALRRRSYSERLRAGHDTPGRRPSPPRVPPPASSAPACAATRDPVGEAAATVTPLAASPRARLLRHLHAVVARPRCSQRSRRPAPP